jgi:hypothetical protein
MNVMNRKLFANRDARRKLANMGGIMVSSPELMQAAQMFQVGGQATVLKTVAHPFGDYDIMSDGSAILKMTGSVIDPNNKSNTLLLEELKNLPAKGTENETSNILSGIFGGGGGNELSTENPYQADIDAAVESFTGASTNENSELSTENPYQADIDAAVESFTGAATENNFDGPIKESGSTITKEEAPADDIPADDIPSSDIPGFTGEKKEAEIKDLETAANDPDASSEQRSSNVSTQVLTDAGFEDVSNMTTKQRVAAYQEMFKEFLGEGDEDANEEKWHNLAMIGFAIAAGQDPSALANIANGLLEGSKVMKSDRAARRKRDDSITSMAIEQVFSEKTAEKDAQLRRELAAAESGYRDPRNPIDAFLNAKSDAEGLLTDITFRKVLLEQNNVAPENQEAWLDQWSTNRAMKTVQSAYGSQTPEFGGPQTQTTPTATDLPTINTQEEYDALPPGSEFIQNGQKRKKP